MFKNNLKMICFQNSLEKDPLFQSFLKMTPRQVFNIVTEPLFQSFTIWLRTQDTNVRAVSCCLARSSEAAIWGAARPHCDVGACSDLAASAARARVLQPPCGQLCAARSAAICPHVHHCSDQLATVAMLPAAPAWEPAAPACSPLRHRRFWPPHNRCSTPPCRRA